MNKFNNYNQITINKQHRLGRHYEKIYMKGYLSISVMYLAMLILSASCGNSGSSTDSSCVVTPNIVKEDIPNSVELIIDDMTLPHEGIPHGVPESYGWAKVPVSHAQSIPSKFQAMVAWGQVYEDICGNKASNTRVQIRDIHAYMLSKQDNQWHLLQSSPSVEGAAYPESLVPHISKPADIRYEVDGSMSVKAGNGYNFHFFTPTRAEINPSDVAAIFTTVQARLIVDNSSLPDDRSQSHYLLNMGGDLWLNTTVDFDKEENNPDIGMGRFKYLTTGWQSFNMLYMEGGIDKNILSNNPPPIDTAGG